MSFQTSLTNLPMERRYLWLSNIVVLSKYEQAPRTKKLSCVPHINLVLSYFPSEKSVNFQRFSNFFQKIIFSPFQLSMWWSIIGTYPKFTAFRVSKYRLTHWWLIYQRPQLSQYFSEFGKVLGQQKYEIKNPKKAAAFLVRKKGNV